MGLPYAVHKCGLLLGAIMLIAGGLTCSFYYKVIISASEKSKEMTYIGIVDFYFGKFWKGFAQVALILYSIGILCSYQAMIAQFIDEICNLFTENESETNESSKAQIILLVNLFVLFPLSLFRQLSSLRYTSVISVATCSYIAGVIFLQTPFYILHKPEIFSHLKLANFEYSAKNGVCIILYAFEASRAIPIVYSEMKKKNQIKMGEVIDSTNRLIIGLYLIIGVFGYLSHADNMPRLIVSRESYNGNSIDYFMIMAKVLLAFTLMLGVPVNVNMTRAAITNFSRKSSSNSYYHITITALIILYSVITAIRIPDAVTYFKIIGGLFTVLIGKIFPTMIYFKQEISFRKRFALGLWTTFLMILGFSSVIETFYS